ncbi:MAG: hypothetical protein CL946_07045 [Ectothiorhodospiraceae bacterium]|nr:hypothetical protein [Ectothiorhodospiraceae bacterium]
MNAGRLTDLGMPISGVFISLRQNAKRYQIMKKTFVIAIVFLLSSTAAQDGINILEKELFQPEVWAVPSYDKGTVDQSGHYNKALQLLEVTNPNGLGVAVTFSYNSNIKYRQSSGWIGLGWSYNPGTITRSVHGGLSHQANYDSYNDELNEQVDFPSLLDPGIARDHDESKDIYYLTLPSGRTFGFVHIGFLGTGVTQVNPPLFDDDPIDGQVYSEFQFLPLNGENCVIRGYFNGPVTVDGFTTAGKHIDPQSNQIEESDFAFFLVTDEEGHTYKYARPTISSMNEQIAWNVNEPGSYAHHSLFVSTWRITDIYHSTSIPELFNGSGQFSEASVLPENKIHFDYTPVHSNIYVHPNQPNASYTLYQTAYLESIEGYLQKLDFELIADTEEDYVHYHYGRYPPGVTNGLSRKRIDKIHLYEKVVGSTETHHVQTVDLSYYQPIETSHVFCSSIEIKNPTGLVIEKYLFTYKQPVDFNDFPAYHDPQTASVSYENLNGYYSIADLNLTERNNRIDRVELGQMLEITYPSGKKETIQYENAEIVFASNNKPFQGPSGQSISLHIAHSGGHIYSDDAYCAGFWPSNPGWDDDLQYAYSRVDKLIITSPYDPVNFDLETEIDYGNDSNYEFVGLPTNIILDDVYFEDGGQTRRVYDFMDANYNDRYVFISRKNPSEVYYRSITQTTNARQEVETRYLPACGDANPYPNTLPYHIYVSAGGGNVFYISFNNRMWDYLGRIAEQEVTDLVNGETTREGMTHDHASASAILLFEDGTDIYSTAVPFGLKFYNTVVNQEGSESYENSTLTTKSYFEYDGGANKGNVLRTRVDWQHNFAINAKATRSTAESSNQYFLETHYQYAFEEYPEMKTRNMISSQIEERQSNFLRTNIESVATGTETFIGNQVSTYRKYNSIFWGVENVYLHNSDQYIAFDFANPIGNEPDYVLKERIDYRLDYGNSWVIYRPDYFLKYYYAEDPATPFEDDYQTPGPRLTGVAVMEDFQYIPNSPMLPADEFGYAIRYDDFGRVEEIRNDFDGIVWTYEYDGKLRLSRKKLNSVALEDYEYVLATDAGNTTNLNILTVIAYLGDGYSHVKSVSYIDGVVGELQVLKGRGGQDQAFIASENLFDDLLRPVGSTKPVEYADTFLERQNLVGNQHIITNPLTQITQGDLSSFFPGSDGPFAYDLSTSDLFERHVQRHLPGNYMRSNAIQSSHDKRFLNAKYGEEKATDADGITEYTLKNRSGLTFYTGNDDDRHTYYVYDPQLNLTQVYHPDNRLTEYRYDHHGNMIARETPDQAAEVASGDETDIDLNPDFQYRYDQHDKLRFSIDPNQSFVDSMGYIKYDSFNRMIERGVVLSTGNFTQSKANNPDFPTDGDWHVRFYYDDPYSIAGYTNQHTRTKLSKRVETVGGETYTTIFSYNTEGLLERVREESPAGIKDEFFPAYSRQLNLLEYKVELNGGILQHHWFEYDQYGRIETVYFDDSETKPADPVADYGYTADGQIGSVNIANGLQTVDYDYDIIGWLTDINDIDIPGSDAFAMRLHYYSGVPSGITPRNNGNIAATRSLTPQLDGNPLILGFNYDNLNRLAASTSFGTSADLYNSSYQYDIMGNITNLLRNHGGRLVDNLSYTYNGNRLSIVTDAVAAGAFEGDFDTFGNGVYGYDANGNVTADENRGLNTIAYNRFNLPKRIETNAQTVLNYGYNGDGIRMWKKVNGAFKTRYLRNFAGAILAELNDSEDTAIHFNFSAAAGDGLEIAYGMTVETILSSGDPVPASKVFTPEEYAGGISFRPSGSGPVSLNSFSMGAAPAVKYVNIDDGMGKALGQRRYDEGLAEDFYYIRDHLGSVRVQFRDDGATGDVVAGNDYYPYGSLMRNMLGPIFQEEDKFKFQGKERDSETGWDYVEARQFDSGIARWLSVDPMADDFQNSSPYVYVSNNPMVFVDPFGKAWFYYQAEGDSVGRWHWHEGNTIRTVNQNGQKGSLTSYIGEKPSGRGGEPYAPNPGVGSYLDMAQYVSENFGHSTFLDWDKRHLDRTKARDFALAASWAVVALGYSGVAWSTTSVLVQSASPTIQGAASQVYLTLQYSYVAAKNAVAAEIAATSAVLSSFSGAIGSEIIAFSKPVAKVTGDVVLGSTTFYLNNKQAIDNSIRSVASGLPFIPPNGLSPTKKGVDAFVALANAVNIYIERK